MRTTPEPHTSIDQSDLLAWLDSARPGDEIIYHRGLLARDASAEHLAKVFSGRPQTACVLAMRAAAIRRAAQYAAGLRTEPINSFVARKSSYFDSNLVRLVDLVQRKLGDCDYLYVARRL